MKPSFFLSLHFLTPAKFFNVSSSSVVYTSVYIGALWRVCIFLLVVISVVSVLQRHVHNPEA